jgi:diguanylate cyclase (GGDEF)-like protein
VFPQPPSSTTKNKVLAILNHRAEPMDGLVAWFEERGWEVKVSKHLGASRTLLQSKIDVAIVFPLTLLRDGIEWQSMSRHLSPNREIPWLIVPWEDAQPSAISKLLEGWLSLADWISFESPLTEMEARVRNLVRLHELFAASKDRTLHLEGQLVTDHKTGLFNDRHFRARLREEFERSQRHGSPATLVLLDLDDFKTLNDSHSYEFGDAALRAVGETIRQCVRSIDIPARIGGDEFAIILPSTTMPETIAVSKRIQQVLGLSPIGDDHVKETLHASLGIASFDGRNARDPRHLFLQANEALKAAKSAGKNDIYFYDANTRKAAGAEVGHSAASARKHKREGNAGA